jgi:hypothetical protein
MTHDEYLDKYEPVLRFARSERFFPMDVESYIQGCHLFQIRSCGLRKKIASKVQSLEDALSDKYFLQFVDSSVTSILWGSWVVIFLITFCLAGIIWREQGLRVVGLVAVGIALLFYLTKSGVRLRVVLTIVVSVLFVWLVFLPFKWIPSIQNTSWATVALCLSPVYLFFVISFLIGIASFLLSEFIPEAPGLVFDLFSSATEDIAESAFAQYKQSQGAEYKPVYYGRVVEHEDNEGDQWKVLQYHYFYAFNEWRLAANGMNHHEGDWEMVAVYLKNEIPQAVLYSQHHDGAYANWDSTNRVRDKNGDLTTHPLVYVALGSHANYTDADVIKGPELFPKNFFQKILITIDNAIRTIVKLLAFPITRSVGADNTIQKIPNERIRSRLSGMNRLTERRLSQDADFDVYEIGLPSEYATGDGNRIGVPGNFESVIDSTKYLKDEKSHREVAWETPLNLFWQRRMLSDDEDWVKFEGLWGVRGWFHWLFPDESGPPGPKWDRSRDGKPPEPRIRWGEEPDQLTWFIKLKDSELGGVEE